ncbi:MAG: cyclophane-forming radical SAM/SPASM peptide maturase GrrM/OscB [Reyranellaceae bacterium]
MLLDLGRPVIGMVVLQPTGFCNINCSYCYLPDRTSKHVMAQSTVKRLFEEVFASGWTLPGITVLWHAGEPLAAPRRFYEEAFATIEALRPPSIEVQHSVQTNGTLIDPDWCKLFLDWKVGVGVSIDGPQPLHDRHRRMRNGKGSYDATMAGIRCLQDNGVAFHALSVLSRESLEMPDELLAFYIDAGIDHVCFNVEESEGTYVSDLFRSAELRDRYASFLRRFWHRARASGKIKFVREIDNALPKVFRPEGIVFPNNQTEPLAMLNVDSYGNVSSFSPELLGMKDERYGDFLLGNIMRDSLADIYRTCLASALNRDIQVGVEACAATCDYFSVCSGGSPVNKLFENGAFTGTTTSFCTLINQVPIDLILEAYDSLERTWTAPSPATLAPSQATAAAAAPPPRTP